MFRSMICLVLAMCGTSALLSWIDPAPTPTSQALSVEQVDRFAADVVAEAGLIRLDHWTSVDVLAQANSFGNATLLAAEPNRTECHFRIDPHGRPFATEAWIGQTVSTENPSAIAIEVSRRGAGQPMTPAQWRCVRSLIAAVSDRLALGGPALPMRLHDDWSDVYSFFPGTTLQLVANGPDRF